MSLSPNAHNFLYFVPNLNFSTNKIKKIKIGWFSHDLTKNLNKSTFFIMLCLEN